MKSNISKIGPILGLFFKKLKLLPLLINLGHKIQPGAHSSIQDLSQLKSYI